MSTTILRKLPSPEEILRDLPLSEAATASVARHRREIGDILEGKDSRFIVIVGPCSAWPSEAVLEYAEKLRALEEKVRNTLKLVMRVYTQKPRTTTGWTGSVNQPDPLSSPDMAAGIRYSREMMLKVADMGLPLADEAVFTHNGAFFLDVLSWVAIGARSTEDQEHRIFASGMDCPVGMKNPTSGSIEIGANSIVAAQYPHVAALDGNEVRTSGNLHAHLILRGGVDGPNYSEPHVREAADWLQKKAVKNPAIIVDLSHDNSKRNGEKHPQNQVSAAEEAVGILKAYPELRAVVKGFMFESFLKEGGQKVDSKAPEKLDRGGLSITDACIGWETTEKLLLELAESLA